MHNELYDRARSGEVTDFLELTILNFSHPIKSLQVDGGSEFRGEFEKSAKMMNIPLYVLPPRSPKLNGCVERSHHTALYEFYGMHGPYKRPNTKVQSHMYRTSATICAHNSSWYSDKRI